MTTKQLKDFKEGKLYIQCKTEKQAKQCLKYLASTGIKWDDEKEETLWNAYKENTLYMMYQYTPIGHNQDVQQSLCYGNACSRDKEEKLKIVQFEDLTPVITEHIIDEENGKVVIKLSNGDIGVAKCNFAEDEFNISIGTKLAIDRAYGIGEYVKVINPLCCYTRMIDFMNKYAKKYINDWDVGNCPKEGLICEVITKHKHLHSHETDIVYVVRSLSDGAVYMMGEKGIGFINRPKPVPYATCSNYGILRLQSIKPKFEPYLQGHCEHYGILGQETSIIDMVGNKLKVGDTVNLYLKGKFYEEKCVCHGDKLNDFIMGISGVELREGKSYSDGNNVWAIIKHRSYTDFIHGEQMTDGIKYILVEEK